MGELILKPLTKLDKEKLRKDMKSYHVAAVLDRATSDRLLRPLPAQCEVLGKDGSVLILTTEASAARRSKPGR